MLSDKRRDLEQRLGRTCEERDALSVALEETMERVRALERHVRDQDSQLRLDINFFKYIMFTK